VSEHGPPTDVDVEAAAVSGPGDLTVIMPLHNAAPWVGDAIASVLANADGLLELLVIDDGSTDDGAAIAEGFGPPVRVVRQPCRGPAAARNAGIAQARGTVVGFLDADDLWVVGRPDPRRALLDDPEVDLVMARAQPVAGDPLRPYGEPTVGIQVGTWLMRRSVFERHGGMDERLRHAEDVDWLLRLREAGVRLVLSDAVTTHYRLRDGSLTRDREATRHGLLAVLHASLQRRGEGAA
jgi:glycosyltransferase involved in cell wall biosynthesis